MLLACRALCHPFAFMPPQDLLLDTLSPCRSPHGSLFVAVQLGFFGILLVEALAGKGVFELVGVSVGNGLGFEF